MSILRETYQWNIMIKGIILRQLTLAIKNELVTACLSNEACIVRSIIICSR